MIKEYEELYAELNGKVFIDAISRNAIWQALKNYSGQTPFIIGWKDSFDAQKTEESANLASIQKTNSLLKENVERNKKKNDELNADYLEKQTLFKR